MKGKKETKVKKIKKIKKIIKITQPFNIGFSLSLILKCF